MSNSQIRPKRSLSIWQFIFILSIAYMIGLGISHTTTVMEKVYWSGFDLEELNDQGEWTKGDRFNIGTHNKIQHLRFNVEIDDSEQWQRPIGLMLGGPFSAEVFWDGELIGNKGAVGENKAQEIPGPIDAAIFVPSRLLTPGTHQINMRLSTQHHMTQDYSVFHFIWLTPYREGGTRNLRYYAMPLVILSALVVLSFQSFRIGSNAGNPIHTGLGLFGFCIAVLLMSEISRAIVNYPYHYHELRGLVGWLSNTAAGIALINTCFRMTKRRSHHAVLYGGVLLFVLSYFAPMKSGDLKLALQFLLLASAPALVFTLLLFNRQISYMTTLPLFCMASLVSITVSTGLFLDSFQFYAALVLIGGAWVWVHVDIKEQRAEVQPPEGVEQFYIKSSNGNKTIAVDDCIALKGEGNYTSLMLADGKTELHQDGLGVILASQPKGFVRVHKSYAVNITLAKHLRSATGSKYWLEMTNHQKVPVSRYRVVEIRRLINQ